MGERKLISKPVNINDDLSGILTLPNEIDSPITAVLLLHGFGTDKNEVNGFYEKLSQKLLEQDIASLRIDFRGFGESSTPTEDASIKSMLDDCISAFNYLDNLSFIKNGATRMMGFSLGASIAILSCEKTNCKSLMLLSPTLNLVNDFTAFLGEKVFNQLKTCTDNIEIDLGWRKIRLGKDFYPSIASAFPAGHIKKYDGELFCISGEKDFSRKNADLIDAMCPSKNKTNIVIPDADHIFQTTDGQCIQDKIISKTCSLLNENTSSTPSLKI